MRWLNRVRYKLYPNEGPCQRFKQLKDAHKELYNDLLEQRITEYDQNNEITGRTWRREQRDFGPGKSSVEA